MKNFQQINQNQSIYEIRVKGHINRVRSAWFENLAITNKTDGTATLRGQFADQSALHGVLIKIRDMNLPLITVQQIEI